jgi:hypothetical protein
MLESGQSAVLEPLVEACRPTGQAVLEIKGGPSREMDKTEKSRRARVISSDGMLIIR